MSQFSVPRQRVFLSEICHSWLYQKYMKLSFCSVSLKFQDWFEEENNRQQGGQLGVMSGRLENCLLSVPDPDKNRQAGLGRPAWSCHPGHLLTAIITSAPASHRYSIQTQLGTLHVLLQPAITNTPASLTRLPFFPLANL